MHSRKALTALVSSDGGVKAPYAYARIQADSLHACERNFKNEISRPTE